MLKSEIIDQAYSLIEISGLTREETPEDIRLALFELDQIMYRWREDGRDVNYNFPAPTTGNELVLSDPNEQAKIHPWALQGVIASLACQLVEYFGKPIPDSLARKRNVGINAIRKKTVRVDPVQYPHRMPLGSGNEWRYGYQWQHYYHPRYRGRGQPEDIIVSQNLDLTADFTNDLAAGDSIASYTITVEPNGGVVLVSDSRSGNVISYRVLAELDKDGTIKIVATTTNGLVIPKAVCFETRENTCVPVPA